MADAIPAAGEHLRVLARHPRFAGSAHEREASAYCRSVLQRHGFSITEEPFVFSAAVGRYAVALSGAVAGASLLAVGARWRSGGTSPGSGGALVLVALVLAVAGWMAARRGVLSWPTHRVSAHNLVAVRGAPATWLVAHLDTKSQPIPSLGRVSALVVLGAAMAATAAAGLILPPATHGLAWLPAVGVLAAVVVARSTVGNDSAGAADNASGVACLLAVASRLAPGDSLGVLITSGEELGLAGALAWVKGRPSGRAINIDTVDDGGTLRCMTHGRRSRGLARELAAAGELVVSPLIPGLLTDGVALAAAGWETVTLSRGTLATLARIHRPADSVGHMTGTGAEALADLLVRYLRDRS